MKRLTIAMQGYWLMCLFLGVTACSEDLSDVRTVPNVGADADMPMGGTTGGADADMPMGGTTGGADADTPMGGTTGGADADTPMGGTTGGADASASPPSTGGQADAGQEGCGAGQPCPSGHVCDEAQRCIPTSATCAGQLDVCGVCDGSGKGTYFPDVDSDGYGGASEAKDFCPNDLPNGYISEGGDCNDSDGDIHPDAIELCDGSGVDENCDGDVDSETWFRDADGDSFGAAGDSVQACADPSNSALAYVKNGRDCNDLDAEAYPQAGYCLVQRFKSPLPPTDYDFLGAWSVKIGNRLLLAAPFAGDAKDGGPCGGAGALFEYAVAGDGTLGETGGKLISNTNSPDGCFGFNVAYDAATGLLAVGVEHVAGLNAMGAVVPDAGAVELFSAQPDNRWAYIATLSPKTDEGEDEGATGTWFGNALAFHRETLLVTRRSQGTNPGMVYAFRKVGTDWQQVQRIVQPVATSSTYGMSLIVQSDIVFVGDPGRTSAQPCFGSVDTVGCPSGGVYTLERSSDGRYAPLSSSWILEPGDLTSGAQFGRELMAWRTGMAVMSPRAVSPSSNGQLVRTGAIYFAEPTGPAESPWNVTKVWGSLPGVDELGPALARSGERIVAGAPEATWSAGNATVDRVGCVAIHIPNADDWQVECLHPPPSAVREGLRFGYMIHTYDDMLLVSSRPIDAVEGNDAYNGDRRSEQFLFRWVGL